MAYDKRGDHQLAIADYTEAIRLVPEEATAYCNRTLAHYHPHAYSKSVAGRRDVPKAWRQGLPALSRTSETGPGPAGVARRAKRTILCPQCGAEEGVPE